MRRRNRITALLLSAAAVLNSGAYALAENTDCVIGFTAGNDAVVTVENAKMANAVIDTVGGRLIIRPNYEKNISVTLSDFAGVSAGSKFVKIRYAFREGFNTDGKMAAEINGRKYILDTLTDKLPGKWYDAICAAEFSGNDEIKLLPVYSDNSEWSTGGDIYIDYVGIFASYADAQNYTEKNTADDITSVPSDNKKAAELVSSDKKFMDGYKEVQRVFKPDTAITRAEMVSVISRIIKDSPETAENSPYSDVSAEDWYYADVSKLYALGAIGGDTFRPTEPITRGELAEILYNLGLLDGGNTRFADVGITDKYYNILLGAGGIFSGYEDNTFRADGSLTRAEAVAAINRVLGVNIGKAEDYVQVYSDVPPTHWAFCDIMAVSDAKAAVDDEDNSSETFDGIFDVYNTRKAEWSPVPIRSKEQKDKGQMGGEGCQYLTYFTIDSTGQYLASFADVLVCTISKDGGKTYTETGRGITAGGLSMGVFDPNNSARLIGGAPMTGFSEPKIVIDREYTGTGLYISEDYMDTFKQTLVYNHVVELRDNDAICFDPSSYDEKINGSAVVYYSTPDHEFTGDALTISQYEIEKGYNEGPGLYRSDDGGYNWKRVNDSICHANLAVSYGGGVVYAAVGDALYRSRDKGETFEMLSKDVMDIDAIKTNPDGVYVLKKKGVYFIKDSSSDLELVGSGAVDVDQVNCFKVSPANPKHMAYSRKGAVTLKYDIMYSTDGGNSWNQSTYDSSSGFFALQPRNKTIVYSPTDENKVWTTADEVESSDDAGASFKWDYNGGLASCINCWWIPNIHNNNLWFVPIQDFMGAYSTDGGDTFTAMTDMSAAHSYGGYMVDENTMYWIESKNWEPGMGTESTLKMTFDGGKTVETKGTVTVQFLYQRCFEAPTDKNVLFAGNLRSADGGKTWKDMPDVACAAAYDRNEKRIFGISRDRLSVMVTNDNGATWEKLFTVTQDPDKEWSTLGTGIDYDYKNDICYFLQYGKVWKWQNGTITSLWENMDKVADSLWCYSLEVDPIHPEVVYASGVSSRASYFDKWNSYYDIIRSCDGGETWQVISTNDVEHSVVKTGPALHREARSLWVNPDTGELLASINMQGMWKFPAPYELDK